MVFEVLSCFFFNKHYAMLRHGLPSRENGDIKYLEVSHLTEGDEDKYLKRNYVTVINKSEQFFT